MQILETHRVSIADLLKKELATDVITMLNDALNEGYSFADVISMLDEQGYKVVIHPVMDEEDDDEEEDAPETAPEAPESDLEDSMIARFTQALRMALGMEKAAEIPTTFDPPAGVQAAAKRAQGWVEDGHAGDGFTAVGRARMGQLAGGRAVSLAVIKKMYAYFARHGVNRDGSFDLVDGKPTPWRVAWDAWGGDAGRNWVEGIYDRYEMKKAFEDEAEEIEDLTKGTGAHSFAQAEDGDNCAECKQGKDNWRHVVKAEGADAVISKAIGEKRFTLAPMYIPDTLDAHGEWTDADELQNAVWEYVRSGDRRIRLQHQREIVAGEWVEVMSLPYPMSVPMYKGDGTIEERTYPAGTVFLGVIWEEWAWDAVKSGTLSGYSIGGRTDRVMEELEQ